MKITEIFKAKLQEKVNVQREIDDLRSKLKHAKNETRKLIDKNTENHKEYSKWMHEKERLQTEFAVNSKSIEAHYKINEELAKETSFLNDK